MLFPSWNEAFENSNLGDKRRNERVVKTANQIDFMSEKKGASVVLTGHSELKAVSRLLNYRKVTPKSLTDKFMDINCSRIKSNHVLIIEDTSELNFAWRKKTLEGLGPTGNGEDQGFFIHPAIVVEPEKQCVQGIAALGVITRKHGQKTTEGEKHKLKDIKDKESYRWIEIPRQGIERLAAGITKTIVADRESDIYDLFLTHKNGDIGKNVQLLIRASHNRKIVDGDNEYLYDEIESWAVNGEHIFHIDGNGKRKAREARCSVRFGKVTMGIPKTQKHRKGKEAVPDMYVVDVREDNCEFPDDALHWMLLTTWVVDSFEGAIEKVEWYRCRWLIEELFRVLKSGYNVESVRFDGGYALMNWCALRLLMAVKIMHIRTRRDDEKKDSAREIFSDVEIDVIEALESKLLSPNSTRRRPPKYTLAWASLLIAIMGGYQALPSAKPFGQTTLWRGLVFMQGAVAGYLAASMRSGKK